jgi:hypothetical protein
MATRVEAMERRVADQNTSQLEEIHLKIVSCFLSRPGMNWVSRLTLLTTPLGWLTTTILHERNATIYGTTIWRKVFFKERNKQFIREGVMQNAMYDANMVHARTVRPHKPRKNLKFLAYSSVAYTHSLNNDN